jgi:hypothetical protein
VAAATCRQAIAAIEGADGEGEAIAAGEATADLLLQEVRCHVRGDGQRDRARPQRLVTIGRAVREAERAIALLVDARQLPLHPAVDDERCSAWLAQCTQICLYAQIKQQLVCIPR